MKKIIIALLAIILPITVNAAEVASVDELTLTNEKGTIKYNGKVNEPTTPGAHPSYAVMCKLYNSKDEEVDLYSSEVNDLKFEGSFTVTANDTYTVSCANYDSGTIKSETIKVEDITNPKTGDEVYIYCIVFAVCIGALGIACMYPRFLKRKGTKTSTAKKTTKKK